MSRRDITGYDWKVIIDPTRCANHPGLFFGGLFRMVDLRLDRDERSSWPDGIVFEHTQTNQQLTFEKGKLFDLTNAKALTRKPRLRNRKGKSLAQKTKTYAPIIRIRRFLLVREIDITGVSGTGVVAEGTMFTDGLSVIHWLREPFATAIYKTLNDVLAVHGHESATHVHFLDEHDPGFTSEGDLACPQKSSPSATKKAE